MSQVAGNAGSHLGLRFARTARAPSPEPPGGMKLSTGLTFAARALAYAVSSSLAVDDRRAWEEDLIPAVPRQPPRPHGDHDLVRRGFDLYRRQLFAALLMRTRTLCHPPTMPDMQPPEMSFLMIERITAAISRPRSLSTAWERSSATPTRHPARGAGAGGLPTSPARPPMSGLALEPHPRHVSDGRVVCRGPSDGVDVVRLLGAAGSGRQPQHREDAAASV